MAVKYRLRKRPTNLSKDIEDGFYPQVIRRTMSIQKDWLLM